MTDPARPPLPEPRVSRRRPGRRLSAAWLVPLLALVIAGTIAARHYASLGPTVRIVLQDGGGIEPGRTEIRFREVAVGLIEEVSLDPDMEQVVAIARLDASVAGQLREDTLFWVVRPQISAGGISGLETLIAGVYMGVDWGAGARTASRRFEALEQPPRTPPGTPGRQIRLISDDGGSLGPGAPIFFKSIEVGQVESKGLSADGRRIVFEAFIRAPYHERLGSGTRFWDTSGIALTVGARGVSLDVGALASILRGGAEFDQLSDLTDPAPLPREPTFRLYASRNAASESLFADDPDAQFRAVAIFEGSVRGLAVDAPVEFRGVTIGEVEDLQFRAGATLGEITVMATLLLQPGRLGIDIRDPAETLDFFARSVAAGLRAKLSVSNILTGALYVELVEQPDGGTARLDTEAKPFPRIPTVQSDLDRLRGSVSTLLARIGNLPLEELLTSANTVLENVAVLTGDEATRQLPGEANRLLASAGAIVDEIRAAAVAERLGETLDAAGTAAGALSTAARDLPGLVDRLGRVAREAETVLGAYGAGSNVNSEAVGALREVREAARAISSLAQALERRPNSLILGR